MKTYVAKSNEFLKYKKEKFAFVGTRRQIRLDDQMTLIDKEDTDNAVKKYKKEILIIFPLCRYIVMSHIWLLGWEHIYVIKMFGGIMVTKVLPTKVLKMSAKQLRNLFPLVFELSAYPQEKTIKRLVAFVKLFYYQNKYGTLFK